MNFFFNDLSFIYKFQNDFCSLILILGDLYIGICGRDMNEMVLSLDYWLR